MERLPPMITAPRREIREDPTEGELAGEESRSVPYQDDATARWVLRHADQLPALARSLVDRLLQSSLRIAGLPSLQRSVLRVVTLGLRTVGSISLSLGHVLPPFSRLPLGQILYTSMMPPTGARRTHHRSTGLLPSCYYNVTVLYHGVRR